MAHLLDISQKLLWILYLNAKETPLPLLLFLLVTTIVSTLAFVRGSLHTANAIPQDKQSTNVS